MMGLRRAFAIMMCCLMLAGTMAHAQETAPAAAAPAASADTDTNDLVQNALKEAKSNAETKPLFTPVYPKVIETAAKKGAQVQFMGEKNGFTGWLLVEKGTPSYVYVSADGDTVFQGMMYDGEGRPITIAQIAEAQIRNPDFFAHGVTDGSVPSEAVPAQPASPPAPAADTAQTPGEALYHALSVTNYLTLGSVAPDAPVLYAFVDPDCPHCHDFLKAVDAPYIQTGKLQLRAIPIGWLGDDSKKRAAWLLAQPDGGAQLMAHAKGQDIPAPDSLTLDGQDLNVQMFKLWKLDGTPILVYRDKGGQVMMVRGMPDDVKAVVESIAPGGGA